MRSYSLVTIAVVLTVTLALSVGACGDDDGAWDEYGNSNYYPQNNSNGWYDPPDPNPISPGEEPVEPEICADATDQPVTLYMSADDSNSQAQPVLTRWMATTGAAYFPTYGPPREYEYLNYYDFDYAPAQPGHLAIVPELRYREDTGEYSLLVAVVAPHVSLAERRPWNLVLSVDTSGSMNGAPLENAQHTMAALAARMQAGDVVSIVNWSHVQNVALSAHAVNGPNDPALLAAINGLTSDGSTDLHAGLVAAYNLANQSYSPQRLNRVVLISDGGANTGITDEDLIGYEASREEGNGIFLVGVGTGGNYNHDLMDTVTDLGKGAYLYVPSATEAQRVFGPERVISNLEVAALNVQLAVTLPPQFVLAEFHGEQVSTDPTEVREQHLSPNDQMLYHSDLVYCGTGDPETVTFTFGVTWTDPFTREARSADITVGAAHLLTAPADHLEKAEILVDYARLLTNADALEATAIAPAGQALLAQIQAYGDATGDPDMAEITATLTAAGF